MTESSSRQVIASRIRELRESAEAGSAWTAEQLGISLERYEAYESGALDVPISALYGIAGLFRVDLTDLLTGKSPNLQRFCVVRQGKGPEVERFPGYRFQSLAFDFQNRLFEPLLVSLDPARNQEISLVTHGGQEFNLVLKGRVRVVLGSQSAELDAGDSIYFDPAIPHGQFALDDAPASFLTIILHDAPAERA